MKLPNAKMDLATALQEFDVWITPSLGEVRDTLKFQQEMDAVVGLFDAMASATGGFSSIEACSPSTLADTFTRLLKGKTAEEAQQVLDALASVLFLVSGKADNNSKCQLPIYLRDKGWETLPKVKHTRRGQVVVNQTLVQAPMPRELKASAYMRLVADLGVYQEQVSGSTGGDISTAYQQRLLQEFIEYILSNNTYVSQLWSIGRSYVLLKQLGLSKERDLLAPLVIFQVRGSVSASGGHDPEELLRRRLLEWGLQPGIDFNTTDVVVSTVSGAVTPIGDIMEADSDVEVPDIEEDSDDPSSKVKVKTRAFDFALPYRTAGWQPKIFVQSQFYAGDSGSVSHKNVDQTNASRTHTLTLVPDARFVEYVDGAGYFSSLNGDLKKLLAMPTTASFTQVRSAAIRLRRELQQVGFLVPLDLEHAILRAGGSQEAILDILLEENYGPQEIERCINNCLEQGLIEAHETGQLSIAPNRRDTVRRYFLLDVAARNGKPPVSSEDKITGSLLVPGYGPFHGIKLDTLVQDALRLAPSLQPDWSNPSVFAGDIRWLCDEGLAISR